MIGCGCYLFYFMHCNCFARLRIFYTLVYCIDSNIGSFQRTIGSIQGPITTTWDLLGQTTGLIGSCEFPFVLKQSIVQV